MKLKLQEDPKEWRKFTAVWSIAFPALSYLLARKGVLPLPAFWTVAGVGAGALLLSFFAPRLFRGFYRGGMTGSFYVGQFMGKVILSLVYAFVLIPMSLLLRVMGKDLLDLRRDPSKETYWKPARRPGNFEQQF
jgi:hypothetical protein